MSRYIIAIGGEIFVGIRGWNPFPTDKRNAYRFTSPEGAHRYGELNFNDYAIVEVPR